MGSLIIPIESQILLIRGHRVLIDCDLAQLYGVTTKRLNEQIKRNRVRFPHDFMFQLTVEEKDEVVANCDHLNKLKFSSSLPHVFTEYGVLMAANLLNSEKAVETSVYIIRAFVKIKQALVLNRELSETLEQLETKLVEHDRAIDDIFRTLREILEPILPQKRRKIGLR